MNSETYDSVTRVMEHQRSPGQKPPRLPRVTIDESIPTGTVELRQRKKVVERITSQEFTERVRREEADRMQRVSAVEQRSMAARRRRGK